MSKARKVIKFFDNLINIIIIIFLIIALIISVYAIFDTFATYEKAVLTDDILKYRPPQIGQKFSLDGLHKDVNKDICGWVRIYNTKVDYPVVKGEDNSEYLTLDYKREYSATGSVFLDYRNDFNFKDDFSILYGHNLKANLMFAEVRNFKNQEYFNEHLEGVLYTQDQVYKIEFKYFEDIDAFSSIYGLTQTANGNNKLVLDEFEKNAITKSDIEISKDDKLILFSTCNTVGGDDRAVLLGKLIPTDEESLYINENIDISLEKIDRQLDESKDRTIIIPNQEDYLPEKSHSKLYIEIVLLLIIIVLIIILIVIKKKKNNLEKKRRKRNEYES